ncbi:hypothetical protein B7486_07405 [cyanobacterium TDX16]|nr:hypothetical protein B7486_07405 [cyanobacterium TDX16]
MTTGESGDKSTDFTETPFSVTLNRLQGAVVVRLVGSCTMEHADRLTDQLVEVASQPKPLIVVDMAGLDFIESTGLGGLVSGYLRARKNEGEIRLVSPPPFIHHLLKLTRLTQLFQVFDDLQKAIEQP